MDREVFVYMDVAGAPVLVGRLWSRIRKQRETGTFEYDANWLKRPDRFALEPALVLSEGPYHTGTDRPMFGAIGDSAPDRWGRALMRRVERKAAEKEGRQPRTLFEIDFLLQVDDEVRAGALRFAENVGGPFVAEAGKFRIPPLVELNRLLAAVERVIDNKDSTVFINGKVNLKDESLALRAVTRPKDWSPLSLRTPITVGGSFASPSVGIEPKRLAGRVLGAIALGAAAGPAAAIIPLVEPGQGKDAADPCTQALPAQAGASAPQSPKP